MIRFIAVCTAALVVADAPAFACGAFFRSETSQNLAIGAQRALMVVAEDTIALHLQLTADSDGAQFSWIVPVPEGGGPPTVELGDQALFQALDQLTTPRVTIRRRSSSGSLCGSSDSGPSAGPPDREGVEHFGGADLGPYTYDIIAGSDAAAVEGWLEDNAYVVPPDFADAIEPYTANSVFVAVRLSAGEPADAAVLRPLSITWPRAFEANLGYALGLSRLSAPEVQPVLLWILADKRQRIANYGSTDVDHLAETMKDRDLEYNEAVTALTEEAGGRLVITEYARDLRQIPVPTEVDALLTAESFYLTRLYAEVPVDAIEDLVITFAADAPEVDNRVEVSSSRPAGETLVLASALTFLFWRRRRRTPGQRSSS